MTATEVAGWLIGNGYAAQVKPDPTTPGDQIVSTTTDGINVDIYLYDCSGQGDARRCTSMQYAAGWPPDVFLVPRDDLPDGEPVGAALAAGFGAEPGDRVVEVGARTGPRVWTLEPGSVSVPAGP